MKCISLFFISIAFSHLNFKKAGISGKQLSILIFLELVTHRNLLVDFLIVAACTVFRSRYCAGNCSTNNYYCPEYTVHNLPNFGTLLEKIGKILYLYITMGAGRMLRIAKSYANTIN
jgi:hypothetical protein